MGRRLFPARRSRGMKGRGGGTSFTTNLPSDLLRVPLGVRRTTVGRSLVFHLYLADLLLSFLQFRQLLCCCVTSRLHHQFIIMNLQLSVCNHRPPVGNRLATSLWFQKLKPTVPASWLDEPPSESRADGGKFSCGGKCGETGMCGIWSVTLAVIPGPCSDAHRLQKLPEREM
ncbi:hypothetical protein GN956_G5527 [Arapaima gigas]